MKYMLLMNYEGGAGCDVPMNEWAPADIEAHMEFQKALGAELSERGELLEAQGLSGPDAAKIVTFDGVTSPVVTDGPYVEAKEFLAGYWIVDVESEARAIEIAAKASAAPGLGGTPIQQPIELRPIVDVPATA